MKHPITCISHFDQSYLFHPQPITVKILDHYFVYILVLPQYVGVQSSASVCTITNHTLDRLFQPINNITTQQDSIIYAIECIVKTNEDVT